MNTKPITLEEVISAFNIRTSLQTDDINDFFFSGDTFLIMKDSLEESLYGELLTWGAKENLPFSKYAVVLYRDFDTGKPVFMPSFQFFKFLKEAEPKNFPIKVDGEVIEIAKRKVQANKLFSELTNKGKEKRTKI
ncbi:hypothetical protein KTE91_03665 [Burkholderia multivorans]|uniref:hypothetical protein n=1 Tax=Burkholderia multivorans TaxID=87883 RepID=UPI001C22211A|nr:hypothetical protein [Burkholderia multivorans]MBU9434181.1 hypothetical protein [Burkholderia multivorans]